MPRCLAVALVLCAGISGQRSLAWAEDVARTAPAAAEDDDGGSSGEGGPAPAIPLSKAALGTTDQFRPLPRPQLITWDHPHEAKLEPTRTPADRSSGLARRALAGAEIATILTAAGAEYWSRQDGLPPWGLSDWRERFSTTRWLMLDTSEFVTNYMFHTIAGASYHMATRTADLGIIESALWGLGASLAWEYGVEYRQKADLNDIIFTTPAGVALGEFTFALGRWVHQRGEGSGWDIARWTLGFPQALNESLVRTESANEPTADGRFRAALGAAHAGAQRVGDGENEREGGALMHLRLDGEIARFDDLNREGSWSRGFTEGNLSSLEMVVSGRRGGKRRAYLLSDTVLAGWRHQHRDGGSGRALTLGSSIAVRYQNERLGAWRDRLGMAHLPGLAANFEMWTPRVRLAGLARAHADYGGVHALAFDRWAAAHPDDIGFSSLAEQGYYHAYGASGRLGASVATSQLAAGGSYFLGGYRAHHARDRREDQLTIKQQAATRFADYELWLRAKFGPHAFVETRFEDRQRRERFEDHDTRARLRRVGVDVGATF